MRCLGRYLKTIARLQRADRLTLYGKIEATFEDIAGLDSWMRMPGDRHARFYFRLGIYCHITRHGTVHLRQDLSADPGGCCGWRTLRQRVRRDELGEPADRAGRKTCKATSCKHYDLSLDHGTSDRYITGRRLSFPWTRETLAGAPGSGVRNPDDYEIRQLLLRHHRHGGPRLHRHADQRPLLLERGAGNGAAQGRGLRQVHGRARLQHLLDGRASFSAGGHRAHSEPLDDGDAPRQRYHEPEDRLRLQHRADVASAAARRRLRDGRHPERRAGDLWRRPRLSHPRGRDLWFAVARPERQPRDVRGRRRCPVQGLRRQTVLAQGQVLDDPARGAVSRLYLEGGHP